MAEETLKSRFKRVCVFCGSSSGKRDSYKEAALELGRELVKFALSCSVSLFFNFFFAGVFVVLYECGMFMISPFVF